MSFTRIVALGLTALFACGQIQDPPVRICANCNDAGPSPSGPVCQSTEQCALVGSTRDARAASSPSLLRQPARTRPNSARRLKRRKIESYEESPGRQVEPLGSAFADRALATSGRPFKYSPTQGRQREREGSRNRRCASPDLDAKKSVRLVAVDGHIAGTSETVPVRHKTRLRFVAPVSAVLR